MSEGWDIHIGPDSVIHIEHGSKHKGSVLEVEQGSIRVQHGPDKQAKQTDKQSKPAEMVIPGLKTTFWDGKRFDERVYYVNADGRLEYSQKFNDEAYQGHKQGDNQGDSNGGQQSEQGGKQAEPADQVLD
jgi:hypothetical protein